MKKKMLAGALICASVAGIAGCGGSVSGTDENTTEISESVTETTTEKESKETKESTTTTTATTSEEKTTETTETTATTSDATTSSAEPKPSGEYKLVVNKVLDGFTEIGDMEYDGPDAMYTYSILNNSTRHDIENRLDSEADSMKNGTTGVSGDVLYASGRTDTGYCITAYRYIAPGDTVSTYAGIQYLSESEISKDTVIQLLSDEYISFTR